MTVCGWNAVVTLLKTHPDRVKRLFFDLRFSKPLKPYVRWLAAHRRIYRGVKEAELNRIAGTVHHGGVAAVIRKPRPHTPTQTDVRSWTKKRTPLLILDRIANPHNLGAIIRTAAFFGLPVAVWEDHPGQARLTTAAYRVAEGGMESVLCNEVTSLKEFCGWIGSAYDVIGANVVHGKSLLEEPKHRDRLRPVALALGNEEEGLSRSIKEQCTYLVTIPGSSHVESLNVSAAAAIFIYHFFG